MRMGEKAIVMVGLIAGLAVALVALWQVGLLRQAAHAAAGPGRYGQEGLRVSGTAVIRAQPDMAVVRLGYESRALKARPARVDNDAVMKKVMAALEGAGVEQEDIQTVEYRVFPMWEKWPRPTTRAWVWHVLHMVEVRVRKVDTVTDVIDAASAAGADKVENVEFRVDNLHKLRGQAREMAAKVAREKAVQLASLMGGTVGRIVAIDDVGSHYRWYASPLANVQALAIGEEPLEVEPDSVVRGGQVVVQVREEVVFALE